MDNNKLVKIFENVVNINKQGKYTIFLYFFGHTNSLDIHYCVGEWAEDKESIHISDDMFSSDGVYDTEYLDYALSELEKLED